MLRKDDNLNKYSAKELADYRQAQAEYKSLADDDAAEDAKNRHKGGSSLRLRRQCAGMGDGRSGQFGGSAAGVQGARPAVRQHYQVGQWRVCHCH